MKQSGSLLAIGQMAWDNPDVYLRWKANWVPGWREHGARALWKWVPGGSREACWFLKPPWRFSCKSSSKIASSEQAFPLSSSSCFPPSGTTFRIGANVCMCPCFTLFADTRMIPYSPTAPGQVTLLDFFQSHQDVSGEFTLFFTHLLQHNGRATFAEGPSLNATSVATGEILEESQLFTIVLGYWFHIRVTLQPSILFYALCVVCHSILLQTYPIIHQLLRAGSQVPGTTPINNGERVA